MGRSAIIGWIESREQAEVSTCEWHRRKYRLGIKRMPVIVTPLSFLSHTDPGHGCIRDAPLLDYIFHKQLASFGLLKCVDMYFKILRALR